MKKLWLVVLAVLIVVSIALSPSHPPPPPGFVPLSENNGDWVDVPTPSVGRYQLVEGSVLVPLVNGKDRVESRILLLDTVTGKVWKYNSFLYSIGDKEDEKAALNYFSIVHVDNLNGFNLGKFLCEVGAIPCRDSK